MKAMDTTTLGPFHSLLVLGTKDACLILTIGWHQPIRLGNSEAPGCSASSREVGKGWGAGGGGGGAEHESGGGRSSLESPGVCASV